MRSGKILVIDDESFIRELIKDFLEMEHIPCECAQDLETTIQKVSRETFQLILLDRNLEEIKAEQVIEKIREYQPDVPIILLTGDQVFGEEYLNKIGVIGAIYKPFKVDELLAEIKNIVEIKWKDCL